MRQAPLLPILCAVTLAIVVGAPTRVSAQTPDSPPMFEVGAVLNQFAALDDGGTDFTLLIGPRVSARLAPTVSAQVDARFAASSLKAGLYGIRLRFMPRADSSSWYVFGGTAGAFQLPTRVKYAAYGNIPAGRYRRPGGISRPMLLNGGAGWRAVGGSSWSGGFEGEVWTSWYGGIGTAVSFELSYHRPPALKLRRGRATP